MIMYEDGPEEDAGVLASQLGIMLLEFAQENDVGTIELIGMMEFCKTKFIAISWGIHK